MTRGPRRSSRSRRLAPADGTSPGASGEGKGRGTAAPRLAGLVCLTLAALLVTAAPAFALPASFGFEGSGAGAFSRPLGIAVEQTSGDVYVADTGNNRIDEFGPEGEFLLAFGWGVADGTTEALQTCTTTCFKGVPGPGAGQLSRPEGIAVDNSGDASQGDIYVVDAGNIRIQKFSPAGAFLLTFGGEVNSATASDLCTAAEAASCKNGVEGPGAGEFEPLGERSVAVGSTGTVYVGDHGRVQLFGEGGALEGEVALPGTGRTQNLAVDTAGDIYRKGGELAGVRKYDAGGTELPPPRAEAGNEEADAISVGPADQLLVNQFFNPTGPHHVLGFRSGGTQTISFDAGGEDADGAHGIAYSEATGAIYLLTNHGTVRIVTPPPPGPLVVSQSATEVGPTSATLDATINPEGPEATTYFFEYGIEAGVYGRTSPVPPAILTGGEFEDQPISSAIAGLQPRTTYHYRVASENAASEVARGPDQEFTTLPPVSVDAASVSGVSATAATLEAELNPHGLPTSYHFEYDTTPFPEGESGHGTSTAVGSAGSGETDVSRTIQIQGLEPGTAYHFRVVATNSLGTTESPDRSFTTQGAATSLLPDGRGWELVTPPNKHGAPLEPITREGGLIQASAEGSAFASIAIAPIGNDSQGARSPEDSQLLSRRGPDGWSTEEIATPHEELTIIHVGQLSEYQFFAEDLSSSVVEPVGATPLSPQTTERTPYRRESDGEFVPLVTGSNVLPGTKFGGEEEVGEGSWNNGVEFQTATPDLSHTVLRSTAVLASGFAEGFVSGKASLYELDGGSLRLISVLPDGKPAAEEGQPAAVGHNGFGSEGNVRGAISDDGSRVFFEAGGHLYLRDVTLGQTLRLDRSQGGQIGETERGVFQVASSDGSKVFFTDESRLTSDSTAAPNKPDLYLCEIPVDAPSLACNLTDLSVDPNLGEAADVQGEVSAIGSAGDKVYFAAGGVLTDAPNLRGEHAVPSTCSHQDETCNLYVFDTNTRQIRLVAVLSDEDQHDWNGGSQIELFQLTARSSPDGRYFTFMSDRSLTGYDNHDVHSGRPDEEVFLFDSVTGALHCVSCNPTGARPLGLFVPDVSVVPGPLIDHPRLWPERWLAGSIPGWTSQRAGGAQYQSRYLSDSGRTFFNSSDALVPQDTNKVNDVYEYEPPGVGSCSTSSSTYSSASAGCVNLISSGTASEESAFLDASENGNDVFFLTQARLTPKDVDGAYDVYDASVGGGEPSVVNPPACTGDSCQLPATPPNDASPGSLTFNGAGNALECPKGKVKKNGKCVKKQTKKKHHKKNKRGRGKKSDKKGNGKKSKRAGSNRGGQK